MRPQFPFRGRHQRTSGHLSSCHECASAVRRERQYLERLRDAPIPPASEDLRARLLDRTRELAEQQPVPAPRSRPTVTARALAVTAGGTMVAAGVLAAGVLAAAGDPVAGDGAGTAAAFSQVSSRTPADGRALTAGQLERLRSEGWACPELGALGFHLETATATVLDGRPAVELQLTDGTHHATLTEQRDPGAEGSQGAGSAGPGTAQDTPAGALQVLKHAPWAATFRAPGRTFTYESDLPADIADDAVPVLQRAGTLAAEGVSAGVPNLRSGADEESLGSRFARGVNRIAALFTH